MDQAYNVFSSEAVWISKCFLQINNIEIIIWLLWLLIHCTNRRHIASEHPLLGLYTCSSCSAFHWASPITLLAAYTLIPGGGCGRPWLLPPTVPSPDVPWEDEEGAGRVGDSFSTNLGGERLQVKFCVENLLERLTHLIMKNSPIRHEQDI